MSEKYCHQNKTFKLLSCKKHADSIGPKNVTLTNKVNKSEINQDVLFAGLINRYVWNKNLIKKLSE